MALNVLDTEILGYLADNRRFATTGGAFDTDRPFDGEQGGDYRVDIIRTH
jgi:hypothetical protein